VVGSLAIGGWAFLRRVVVPVARWYLLRLSREQAEAANRRLQLRMPAFKLTRRRRLVERLVRDPEVAVAVAGYAREKGIPEAVAAIRAERYAQEIVPSFQAFLYFRVGAPLAGALVRAFYRVRAAPYPEALGRVDEETDVVFVMNHRSNLDYVVLIHLTAERVTLSFAAGEWARFWPVGPVVRAMGSFFVRRGSGNPLYRRVLARFVRMAVEGGLTMVVYPEGGLSRDGSIGNPKVGLLDYMLRGFGPGSRDLLFVPVAVNYDWVLEDESLLRPPERRPSGPSLISSTLSLMLHNLRVALGHHRRCLGEVAVAYGEPLSARAYANARGLDFSALDTEARVGEVKRLADVLMRSIAGAMPAVAVPAVARVLLAGEALSLGEIGARVSNSTGGASALDARSALETLTLRGLARREGGLYRAAPGSEALLRYYAAACPGPRPAAANQEVRRHAPLREGGGV
jgi:glycerol-3-phosphate O-acyltransferase